MANSATLLSLLQRVAAVFDEPDFDTDSFVSKAQATQWLNDALARIHYMLANSGSDYFRKEGSITLVSGTSSYDLPSDFHQAVGVDEIRNSKRFRVPRFMSQERNKFEYLGSGTPGYAGLSTYEYRIAGQKLWIIPEPSNGASLSLWYTPQFTKLSLDADLVDPSVSEGLEEYAVLDAAIKCGIKEDVARQDLIAQREVVWQQVRDYAQPRDVDEPRRYIDVHGRFGRFGVRAHRWR